MKNKLSQFAKIINIGPILFILKLKVTYV